MENLQVFYKDKGRVNTEFDKEIERVAKKFGLLFTGSGFACERQVRDLYFAKKEIKGGTYY